MGGNRKRLIVQADLTSEEDQAFLAWLKEQRKRRKLGEQIRQGLRLQYGKLHGMHQLTGDPFSSEGPATLISPPAGGTAAGSTGATNKLQRLVGSL